MWTIVHVLIVLGGLKNEEEEEESVCVCMYVCVSLRVRECDTKTGAKRQTH